MTLNGGKSDSSITNMSDVCILQIASSTCIKIKEHKIATKIYLKITSQGSSFEV